MSKDTQGQNYQREKLPQGKVTQSQSYPRVKLPKGKVTQEKNYPRAKLPKSEVTKWQSYQRVKNRDFLFEVGRNRNWRIGKKYTNHDNKVVVFGSAFTNGHLMFMISYYYIVLIPHSCSLQSYLIKDFFLFVSLGLDFVHQNLKLIFS